MIADSDAEPPRRNVPISAERWKVLEAALERMPEPEPAAEEASKDGEKKEADKAEKSSIASSN